MKTYSENPSFSNQKNLEETEQQLDEVCIVCRETVAWRDDVLLHMHIYHKFEIHNHY